MPPDILPGSSNAKSLWIISVIQHFVILILRGFSTFKLTDFYMTFLVVQMVKCLFLQYGRPGFDLWVGKIPWRKKWQSTPALLPGKSHGQRSLVGYSPWGRKESDTTE